jgi:hypothetical protein
MFGFIGVGVAAVLAESYVVAAGSVVSSAFFNKEHRVRMFESDSRHVINLQILMEQVSLILTNLWHWWQI